MTPSEYECTFLGFYSGIFFNFKFSCGRLIFIYVTRTRVDFAHYASRVRLQSETRKRPSARVTSDFTFVKSTSYSTAQNKVVFFFRIETEDRDVVKEKDFRLID